MKIFILLSFFTLCFSSCSKVNALKTKIISDSNTTAVVLRSAASTSPTPSPSPSSTPSPSPTPSTLCNSFPLPAPTLTFSMGTYFVGAVTQGKIRVVGSTRTNEMGIVGPIANSNYFFLNSMNDPLHANDGDYYSVSAGGYQMLASTVNGNVFTAGHGCYGQSGNGTVTANCGNPPSPSFSGWNGNATPVPVPFDSDGNVFEKIVKVVSYNFYNSAIKCDGSFYTWGDNSSKSLGYVTYPTATPSPQLVPKKVIFPEAGVFIVDAYRGTEGIIALDKNGIAWAWGPDGYRLPITGAGITPEKVLPQNVGDASDFIVKKIARGADCTFYLTNSKNLYVSGPNKLYCMGNGVSGNGVALNTHYGKPMKLNLKTSGGVSLQGRIVDISSANDAAHVILDDGTLWGWGNSHVGQVGDGTFYNGYNASITDTSNPLYQKPLYQYTDVTWAGSSTNMPVPNPVQITNRTDFKELFGGAFYAYVVTSGNRVFSWGRNKTGNLANGQVGDVIGEQYSGSFDDKNIFVPTEINVFQMGNAIGGN